ncbi:hypothetical protein [Segetibacter aerophilus]|uniref:Outer membrane protein beta-barrel domain-containing protein n=1 Tax=Segetibacter aerophilus TaxID=670293 RepID=A0A512BFF9_9BACT|nr:hypothetical protein [Segetibacter aerophilus]GEO10708.1 hypothetical protein SAE01_32040 [Segetibacter aerophilus]
MRLLFKTTLFFLFFLSLITKSFSQQPGKKSSPFRFLINGALEVGGDKIAEVYFTNGNKQGVRTGQGISIGVGGQFQMPGAEKFLLRSTVGFKYVTTAADNAHIRLTRVPIVVTANFMASPKLRLGAGLSMHKSISFNTDGVGEDYHFKGANGPTFEIAYAGVGLTYTAMKYEDQSNHSYSANAIGLSFSLVIPNR